MLNKKKKQSKLKKIIGGAISIVVILILVFVYFFRIEIKNYWILSQRKRNLPPEISFKDLEKNKLPVSLDRNLKPVVKPETENNPNNLPAEIDLAVPFLSQAPFKVWDAIHEDTCEEASVLMVNGFYKGEAYTKQQIEDELLKMNAWELENFGYFEDTDVAETAKMMKEVYGLNAVAIYDISIEDIKKELAADRPVIIPAAGKLLHNPYFSNGGPVYHMLVLKGYTKDGQFISNDPGTNTLGANFTYEIKDFYKAIHDWVLSGDILAGRKAMIVVR